MHLALITGGARRLGCAMVRYLVENDYKVIFTYKESTTAALELCDELNNSHKREVCGMVQGDLLEEEDTNRMLRDIEASALFRGDSKEGLHLVHNASVYKSSSLTDTPLEQQLVLQRQYNRIHMEAPLQISLSLLNHFKTAKNASIVGITDCSRDRAWKDLASYAASKAGLQQLMVNLAGELPQHVPHLRCNTISPGAIMKPEHVEENMESIVQNIPLKRMGKPKEIAEAVRFLCESTYINGANIKVDGGWSLT